MDYSLILRYLLVVSSACMALENTASITEVLQTSPKDSGKNRRNQRVRHGLLGSLLDEERPLKETKKAPSCCLNGGLCIMNAFCHCKKNFYGRRCEHRQRQQSCGTIRHGTWMAVACHLCHCFDGQMSCKKSAIPGCESMPYSEGREAEPDYNVGLDKKVEDYDMFYDGYEEEQVPTSTSSTSSQQTNVVLVTVAIVTSLLRKSGS